MDQYDISFFLQGDRNLNLLTKYWYDPVFLISPHQRNLKDIFEPKDRERITELGNKAYDEEGSFICDDGFQIISPTVTISLCMMVKNERVFVLGMNISLMSNEQSNCRAKDVIHRFMGLIISTDRDLMTNNMEIVRSQFEEIQKLNNQLQNIKRQLEKSNAQLHRLNLDLNNRLVKDELTGLVSRYQYREEIEMAIANDPQKFGIFTFLDLDRFKQINDTFGHRAGDEYLKEFARRLKGLPFENFIAIRISGDEFGLYIHGYKDVGEAECRKIWENIQIHVLDTPITIDSQELKMLCSGGMAVYGLHTKNFFDLIEYADFAMYEAKNSKTDLFKVFNKDRYMKRNIMIR
ncbi:GGDEF domain-containing protein [Alkalibacter saccharofermentans]|uniref:Diguanylate cyclase (GGDEF) domain-containing protein n=1 Tax=Alkalibacter saccharofermentans DSM 14828 TaxID=1120975 RepID=A0A1M5A3T8_9FIRM|nr:GGDEF domain-containing protein [Alkalibacter saccharofermentans]SHF24875.1 diguanylate cyclase (GGDEF) domain-containing protein [Alkalibacter saccharofermentans DSM 14828]